MRSAHADSSSALAGRHTNSRRRLGVSPGPVALNGPVMVTDTTEGRAPRFRPGGRSGASDSASLRSTKATPTLRGPAGTAKRKAPWFGAIVSRRNAWPPEDVRDGLALAVDADLQLMDVAPTPAVSTLNSYSPSSGK